MSLRFFVYYCGVSAAGAALLAWSLGRLMAADGLLPSTMRGLFLGASIALAVLVGLALGISALGLSSTSWPLR